MEPSFIKDGELFRAAFRYADGSIAQGEFNVFYPTSNAATEAARQIYERKIYASRMTGWTCLAIMIVFLAIFGLILPQYWPISLFGLSFVATPVLVFGIFAYGTLVKGWVL